MDYHRIIEVFNEANEKLLKYDSDLFRANANERTLCGALMLHLHDLIKDRPEFYGYYIDIEYNRYKKEATYVAKTILGLEEAVHRINCDLIIHGRGTRDKQENLLALEMKKSTRQKKEKDADRERLKKMTDDVGDWHLENGIVSADDYRYLLGIYYEVDIAHNIISVEYYYRGKRLDPPIKLKII